MSSEEQFKNRMQKFQFRYHLGKKGVAISIKVGIVNPGYFDWQHSPEAYRIIDEYMRLHSKAKAEYEFEKHESGPEILIDLVYDTAVITLAKSIIDLVATILNARSEGMKKGDRRNDSLELIVRTCDDSGKIREEKVLRYETDDKVIKSEIKKGLEAGIAKILPKPKKKPSKKKSVRK
ncbi:MAG: hypothetical protein HZA04_00240 [Nitrospinae bacterium]|nr:hypothetical protein [Nitrospinota bacterium]